MYRLDQMSFQGDKDDALNFLSTFVRFVLKVIQRDGLKVAIKLISEFQLI
uniref:Uncharacterized protein n=1 Tax=Rhizophagus irregularis (strain DAOM 181602 / DAOM 197198 / MUCL 43194) TaxID=747089 RepID=U9U9Q4_RHIID